MKLKRWIIFHYGILWSTYVGVDSNPPSDAIFSESRKENNAEIISTATLILLWNGHCKISTQPDLNEQLIDFLQISSTVLHSTNWAIDKWDKILKIDQVKERQLWKTAVTYLPSHFRLIHFIYQSSSINLCTKVQLIHFHLTHFTDHSPSHSHSPYLVLLMLHHISTLLCLSFF